MMYGREVLLDIVDANPEAFTRKAIEAFLIDLCATLRLERADLHFWDYEGPEEYDAAPAHLRGVSAVQFITTSTVVVHTIDVTRQVSVNVFGCGEIDAGAAERVVIRHFGGRVASMHSVERGRR